MKKMKAMRIATAFAVALTLGGLSTVANATISGTSMYAQPPTTPSITES